MKSKSPITKNFFEDLKPEYESLVNLSVEISDRIEEILNRRGISQKQFAELLGKSESEISKWLSGMHNFTIKSIVNIENVLQEKILQVYSCNKNLELDNEMQNTSFNFYIASKLKSQPFLVEANERDFGDWTSNTSKYLKLSSIKENATLSNFSSQYEECRIN